MRRFKMTADVFNEIVERRLIMCRVTLSRKKEEYSREEDRLHNFKVAALFEDVTPEMALRGMLTKHVVSVYDMVDDIEFRDKIPTHEMLHEKITDWINYALLLEALIEERRSKHD
jgi:protein-tyrosine phosphatase